MIPIFWENLHTPAVTVVISSTSRTKGYQTSLFSVYQNITPNVYASVPSNTIDRPMQLVCHFISCPIFPTALSTPFS